MGETMSQAAIRELGAELRKARENAGLTQRGVADAAEISSHSRIGEMEAGKRLLRPDELDRLLRVLNLSGSERSRLAALARPAGGPGALYAGMSGVSKILAQLIDYESAATRITDVSPLLIPGLLQTTDYARAVIGGGDPDSVLRVTLRAGRRGILTRSDPCELHALIDSEALVRPVAPPAVMADQLRHILRLAELDNVSIQVVQSTTPGYHPMLAGPFELIEFAAAAPVVLLDHHRSSAFLWQREDVQEFMKAADLLRQGVAMTPKRSVEVIAGIVHGMETTG